MHVTTVAENRRLLSIVVSKLKSKQGMLSRFSTCKVHVDSVSPFGMDSHLFLNISAMAEVTVL